MFLGVKVMILLKLQSGVNLSIFITAVRMNPCSFLRAPDSRLI